MGTYRSGGKNKLVGFVRLARGGRRPDPDRELPFASAAPTVPASVSADPKALAHWQALVDRLQASGVLQAGHVGVYTLYAHAAADYDRLREQFAAGQYETVIIGSRKTPVGAPLERQIDRARRALLQLEGELGLTPLSSGRTASQRAAAADRDDEFERFLSTPRPRIVTRRKPA